MSRGIGAHAKKVLEDDETVIYEYGGYNLNETEYWNENHILDGTITIQKNCFVEPEIHEKLKKCQVVERSLLLNVFQYLLVMTK